MSAGWAKAVAESENVALVVSLLFNLMACGAIYRLWKSRDALQDKVTNMLSELVTELSRLTSKLSDK